MARRKSFEGARCLVTGASAGLGEAIARRLLREGAVVLLTGRSQERLERIAADCSAAGADASRIFTVAGDLTKSEDLDRIATVAESKLGGLDVLIQSAGVGATGPFETHDPSVLRRLFEINVFALAETARAMLPLLRRGENPVMVNIGSIVARRALPGRVEYCASKFAVAGFTEGIRAEWAKFGIHVMLMNPGFTDTDFERNVLVNTSRHSTQSDRVMTAAEVAEATLKAIKRGSFEVTLTFKGRLLLLMNRIAPRFVDRRFNQYIRRLYADVVEENRVR